MKRIQLVTVKARGLGDTPDTRWIELKPSLNVIQFSHQLKGKAFLSTIQTINPPYDCSLVDPFSHFPRTIRKNGYDKIIKPHKRTIALGVFSAIPSLVAELAATTPLFYETDRIEVGRRLDYSRWINFVELASSTRWSEISMDIGYLLKRFRTSSIDSERIHHLTQKLQPTDRIKGESMDLLDSWLRTLLDLTSSQQQRRIHKTLNKVQRARFFNQGRAIVRKRLPLFFLIDLGKAFDTPVSPASFPLYGTHEPLGFLLSEMSIRIAGHDSAAIIAEIHRKMKKVCQEFELMISCNGGTCTLIPPAVNEHIDKRQDKVTINYIAAACLLVVIVAQVLYQVPPILLLDIPTRIADKESIEPMMALFEKLGEQCQCILTMEKSNKVSATMAERNFSIIDISQ